MGKNTVKIYDKNKYLKTGFVIFVIWFCHFGFVILVLYIFDITTFSKAYRDFRGL